MKEKSIIEVEESRPGWEALEAYAREGVRRLLQQLLEEEVEEALGRRRYERREGVDAAPGYRNGRGKPRRLSRRAGRSPSGARACGACSPVRESPPAALQRRTQAAGCCCRSCTCTVCSMATLIWRCGVYWARAAPSRPSPSRD